MNKDFNKEFEKAKKRFNDIALNTGREHLVLDNKVAISNGAKLDQPEAYPEKWTLADLVAESDYQVEFNKEIFDGASDNDERKNIKNELNRWKNFRNRYLPLVKELNIQLFCNHCSNLLDVKKQDTIFYKDYLSKVNELIPKAELLAKKCKDACKNGDLESAYKYWCEIYDCIIPGEVMRNTSEIEKNLRYSNHSKIMELFSDDEVYRITDYGKELEYRKYEEQIDEDMEL